MLPQLFVYLGRVELTSEVHPKLKLAVGVFPSHRDGSTDGCTNGGLSSNVNQLQTDKEDVHPRNFRHDRWSHIQSLSHEIIFLMFSWPVVICFRAIHFLLEPQKSFCTQKL